MRSLALILFSLMAAFPPATPAARPDPVACGTHPELLKEQLFLHRQAERLRRASRPQRPYAGQVEATAASTNRSIGNIAVMEADESVVVRGVNPFDLDQRTVRFLPLQQATRYRFETGAATYDEALASAGSLLPLDDDDTREVALPFPFAFYGQTHLKIFVNSDGNLTFREGDGLSADRSLGRFTSGPARIAPLFHDLDPSMSSALGVRTTSTPNVFAVSWVQVPTYGLASQTHTFQVRLYPDGRIEFAYAKLNQPESVVGIAPGGQLATTALISYSEGASEEFDAGIAERFSSTGSASLDLVAAAHKFYSTNDDAYDYLVFYNDVDVGACGDALACEITIRTNGRTGYGDRPTDEGKEFGSGRRLQAVMNMGRIRDYPSNPNAVDFRRFATGDTPLTILAHEAGHLFLAFASIREPAGSSGRPMLGRQMAHWAFNFNSEASFLEGNRIQDDGAGASPRFTTTATVSGFSPLDQYLMGLLPPEQVPPTFLVQNTPWNVHPSRAPQRGVNFDGDRRDITIQDIIAAEGRRTPDHTVSQREFRFAFIVIVEPGSDPTPEVMQRIEALRTSFEQTFREGTGGRATANTTLAKALHVSLFPAAGVLLGGSRHATVSLQKDATAPVTVQLRAVAGGGAITLPASVQIPAGAREATFQITGTRAGVVDVTADVAAGGFEVVTSKVQVLAPSSLTLELVSGDRQSGQAGVPLPQPVVARVIDHNRLPFAGVPVLGAPSLGGALNAPQIVSDAEGLVRFHWTPAASALNELTLRAEGSAAQPLVVTTTGRPTVPVAGVVNAASFSAGLVPGGLTSIFGVNLSNGATGAASRVPLPVTLHGVQVLLNGVPAPLLYVSDRQINLFTPHFTAPQGGIIEVIISTPVGTSDVLRVPALSEQPAIFFDAPSEYGAVLVAGTGQATFQRPAAAGDYLEVYATGLGATQLSGATEVTVSTVEAFLMDRPAKVHYSGVAPGFVGLYQVNVEVPSGLLPGDQSLFIRINGVQSNTVKVLLR